MIILVPASFRQYLGFHKCYEYLPLQELILEFSVKSRMVPVLPGTARFDIKHLNLEVTQPFPDGLGYEFGPVV